MVMKIQYIKIYRMQLTQGLGKKLNITYLNFKLNKLREYMKKGVYKNQLNFRVYIEINQQD